MQKYVIIVAGGVGNRMQNTTPKQFLPILGKPLIYYAIQAFLEALPEATVIVVLHKDYLDHFQSILETFGPNPSIITTLGGASRYQSVQNGIAAIQNAQPHDLVLVHDAARPCIDSPLIHRLCDAATANGAAIPVWPVAESIRIISNEGHEPIDRNKLRLVQTPQVAQYQYMQKAFLQDDQPAFTDEATVLESIGIKSSCVEGLGENIKVTTPDHLDWMEWVLQRKAKQ